MTSNNQKIADLLRSVATAMTLKKDNSFKIKAYETAADSIEHSNADIKDIWEEGKLDDVPGIGKSLQEHLDEYFKTGKVKHFESLEKDIPPQVFEFIKIPGIGPKTAMDLAKSGIKTIESLEAIVKEKKSLDKYDISEKLADKVVQGIEEFKGLGDRMLLPAAFEQAEQILEYLRKNKAVLQADFQGSLRRMVSTIGDLDFVASTNDTEAVLDYFTKMPFVESVVSRGSNKSMVVLKSGKHSDILVGKPENYGALLQHFTGSKNHNIKLRTYAEKHNLSLSEFGVKNTKTGKVTNIEKEEELYKMLKMQTPPPEIREDTGEIEAALEGKLPKFVEISDVKGDLHLHSNFPIERPSHAPGADSMEDIIKRAEELGYSYIGISDHSPGFKVLTPEQIAKTIEKRSKYIEQLNKDNKIRILNGLEIDILPDGTLSVPDGVLQTLDYVIAGIHSSHRMDKEGITKRLIKTLENPHVDIIAHPTGRLINERGSYDADWEAVFKVAAKNKKIMEIDGFPNRLDLRDDLVRMALKYGVKFSIDTDAHEVSQMDNMLFGVSVGRRGWAEAKDVVNTWDFSKLVEWFKK